MEFAPAKELALMTLREQPLPDEMLLADTPDKAVEFWQAAIASQPRFNGEVENFAVLFLNTRRRVKGFQIVTQGTADTLLVHPREVFRVAILAGAAALILLHCLCAAAHKLCASTMAAAWRLIAGANTSRA